jgi:hypothetical protein
VLQEARDLPRVRVGVEERPLVIGRAVHGGVDRVQHHRLPIIAIDRVDVDEERRLRVGRLLQRCRTHRDGHRSRHGHRSRGTGAAEKAEAHREYE